MPYTRKSRRYNRKPRKPMSKPSTKPRPSRKNYRKSKPKPVKQPFSHMEFTNMKYQFNNDLTTTFTQNRSGTEFAFLLNDINRPYLQQATTDYLPQGHSQYTTVFNKFKVSAAKVTFELNPNMTGKQVTLLIQLNNSANYLNNIQNILANQVSGLQNTWTYTVPTDKKFKFTKYVSMQHIEALTSLQFKSDMTNYIGTPTTSVANANTATYKPAKVVTMKFSLINETDNTVVFIPFEMRIDYYCTFYDRKRLPQTLSTA